MRREAPEASQHRIARRAEAGMALLAVLVMLVAIGASSVSFVWFMNQQQARAGGRFRGAAATALSEAGVYRALAVLESVTPDGRTPGRTWRPTAHTEMMPAGALPGRYTIAIADGDGGSVVITSTGEAGGARRRLRARVTLASPAFLSGVFGASLVQLTDASARVAIRPYGSTTRGRPWAHLAAGREIWLPRDGAAIDGAVRVLLSQDGRFTVDEARHAVDEQQLQAMGLRVVGSIARADPFPRLPAVDTGYYTAAAAANATNAGINRAAGDFFGDAGLARKRDSVYTPAEFERMQAYLASAESSAPLQGIIFVAGGVVVGDGQRLQITEGALVTVGSVRVGEGSRLEITRATRTRGLPGLLVADNGALLIGRDARVQVRGLAYTSRVIDVDAGAHVDLIGALAGNDQGLSLRIRAASVVVHYDPAVMGTLGLRVHERDPVVAWVASWEELP